MSLLDNKEFSQYHPSQEDIDEPIEMFEQYDIADFKLQVEFGYLIDDDGIGYAVIDNQERREITILPSKIKEIPLEVTHINWYNK